MNILIYHTNLHLYGGGEAVALTIAEALSKEHSVTFLATKNVDKQSISTFFGADLSNVKIIYFGKNILSLATLDSYKQSLLLRAAYPKFKKYDMIIDTCTNGLFFKKILQKTICYVHFPNYTRQKRGLKSALNPVLIKEKDMYNYDLILCNSKFTQQRVKEITRKPTKILYPPVKTEKIIPRKKEKTIITIGRYSPEKKLEILISSFIQIEKMMEGWKLIIIGSLDEEGKKYHENLKKIAKGHRIELLTNIKHKKVLEYLEKASIYWHARGYGETNPEEFENFGITTAEAMAAGCTPLVINLGAQPEVVGDKKYTWNTPKELQEKTLRARKYSQDNNLILRAQNYSSSKFRKAFLKEFSLLANK